MIGSYTHTPESFLASCVPDLELETFIGDVDDLAAKLDSDGVTGLLFEFVLNELVQETWLAHSRTSYDEELEEVIVLFNCHSQNRPQTIPLKKYYLKMK